MNLDKHINEVCISAYLHARALRHVRSSISDDTAKTVAQALVGSWLDYASEILHGASKYNISKLQQAQNDLTEDKAPLHCCGNPISKEDCCFDLWDTFINISR